MTSMQLIIDELVAQYHYAPLPETFSHEIKKFFLRNLPNELKVHGDTRKLHDALGRPICDGYRRIVIGDYGAYVEFTKEQLNPEANLKVKHGQEFREDNHYNCKYNWLTNEGNSVKIYLQKARVKYADYIPGLYYIHVDEVEVENDRND